MARKKIKNLVFKNFYIKIFSKKGVIMNSIKLIEQGDIWEIQLEKNPCGSEQGGKRPFIVISSSEYNKKSKTPIGFIMSTSKKKSGNQYTIPVEGMPDEFSHINVSQIRTVSEDRFSNPFKKKLTREEIHKIFKYFEKAIININHE